MCNLPCTVEYKLTVVFVSFINISIRKYRLTSYHLVVYPAISTTRTQPRNSNTTEDDLETVSPTIEKKEGTKYQDEIPIINISNKPCQFAVQICYTNKFLLYSY
jgi:hypothetical protein